MRRIKLVDNSVEQDCGVLRCVLDNGWEQDCGGLICSVGFVGNRIFWRIKLVGNGENRIAGD